MTDAGRTTVIVLQCGVPVPGLDAIVQYSQRLRAALIAAGLPAEVRRLRGERDRIDANRMPVGSRLIVQFNPFAFGARGLCPQLVRDLARIRRRRPDIWVGLMCHETLNWHPSTAWKVMRAPQRLQLALLTQLAHHTWASTDAWARDVRRVGGRRVTVLPVGSNLPDRRDWRDRVRDELGIESGTLVLASFSTGHTSHRDELVRAVARALTDGHRPLILTLGAGRTALGLDALDERVPGMLSDDELAGLLAASDLFVSPYVDGISSRRGTTMAALQHALPVVGAVGTSTDATLRQLMAAVGVTGDGDDRQVVDAALRCAADPNRRAAHGARGHSLYTQEYDWPIIATRLVESIPGAPVVSGA